jgi:hypothetical protein
MAFDKTVLLKDVKLLLGKSDSDNDALFNLLINRTIEFLQGECNDTFDLVVENADGATTTIEMGAFPKPLEGVIEELVVARFKRMGYEGKSSESLGDYSVSLTAEDIPLNLKSRIYPYRKMRVV